MAVLTDTKARSLKPDQRPIAHGAVTGLTLHPSSKSGHGKWVFRYISPVTHKRRNAGLGTYPEVSIANAAKLALAMRENIALGLDPLDLASAEAPKIQKPTFQEAAKILHEELSPGWKNAKHAQQWINTIDQYAIKLLGQKLLENILPKDIADVLRPIWLEKLETASRVKQRLDAVMAWGWAHGYCVSNPVDVVHFLLPQQPGKAIRTQHQPAMPWRILPKFMSDNFSTGTPTNVTHAMLEFLILTAARSGEVRGAVWSEIDFEAAIWNIPAGRMKAKLSHRIPLSPRAIQLLTLQRGVHKELIFPSPRDEVALSDMALTAFLRRIKAPSDTPERFATAHGFRSSFRDWCSENGYARDLAERALAHSVQNKVEAAYHRTDLLEQRREMMNNWECYLLSNQMDAVIQQDLKNV